MRPNSPRLFLLLVLVCVILSCNSNGDNSSLPQTTAGKYNFGVLRYDSVALEYRLDSIHNRGLVLQFVTEAGNSADPFQVIAYAYDTMGDHNNSWMPDTLRVIRDSAAKTFNGKITIGNNEVTREQLLDVVRNPQGQRFAYDYVIFTPTVEGVFNHVVYMLRPYKSGKPVDGSRMQMTSPMPPTRVWD